MNFIEYWIFSNITEIEFHSDQKKDTKEMHKLGFVFRTSQFQKINALESMAICDLRI